MNPAIDAFLADSNDSRIPRIQARRSNLPHLTAPIEPCRAGTSLLVSPSGRGSSTGGLLGLSVGESGRPCELISSSFSVNEISKRPHTLVGEVLDGPLVSPPLLVAEPIFECPFHFLQCYSSFTDQAEWFKHSLTHFGDVDPPSVNECPFCDRHYGQFTSSKPMDSWKFRMMSVSSHHRQGATVRTARPDFLLINYMWENNLMTKAQFRNLRCRTESPTAAYTVTEPGSSRRKQR